MKITKRDLALLIIAILFLWNTIVSPLVFAFGVRHGHHEVEQWETTKVHYEMQIKGYQYCPYCGEKF